MLTKLKSSIQRITSSQVKLPKKAMYRQRAHSNPLVDAHFDIPLSPDHMNW